MLWRVAFLELVWSFFGYGVGGLECVCAVGEDEGGDEGGSLQII